MYTKNGLMFPYVQNLSQAVLLFDEFCCSQKTNALLGMPSSFVQTSTISDYNLGGEGDLFKAPEPVMGEPSIGLDPVTAAISMTSCGDDVICSQSFTVSDIESSIESGQLLSELYYECRKDLLAKEGNETPLSEVLSINLKTDETFAVDKKSLDEAPLQKSVSSDCLRSMDSMPEAPLTLNFLDFPIPDFGAVYGMRRAFSEGDIQDRAGSFILSFCDRLLVMVI